MNQLGAGWRGGYPLLFPQLHQLQLHWKLGGRRGWHGPRHGWSDHAVSLPSCRRPERRWKPALNNAYVRESLSLSLYHMHLQSSVQYTVYSMSYRVSFPELERLKYKILHYSLY